MGISMNFRGDIKSKEANLAVQYLKQQNKVSFVECCPTGFKIGLNTDQMGSVDNDCVELGQRSAVMFGNNTLISRFFTERISKIYDKMYQQRAFVHWYVDEGMA